jgi:hypothetical protein
MAAPLRQLGPSEAFHDSEGRSFVAGVAGFLVFGCLQATGAFPIIYRASLFVASGMLAAFLMTLTLSLAYYHRRWKLGVCGAILVLCKVIKADVGQGLGISRISHSPAAEISTSLFSKNSSSLDSKMWSIIG